MMDYGAKNSILRSLRRRGCDLYVFPYNTPAEEVRPFSPTASCSPTAPGTRRSAWSPSPACESFYDSGLPIFGICLGHQITALAMGAKTVKMDYGHHGVNHPVKELSTGRVYHQPEPQL